MAVVVYDITNANSFHQTSKVIDMVIQILKDTHEVDNTIVFSLIEIPLLFYHISGSTMCEQNVVQM